MTISLRGASALGRLVIAVAQTATRRDNSMALRRAAAAMSLRCTSLGVRHFGSAVPLWEKKIIPCPTLADSITSGEISQWVKNVGESVDKDGVVCVLETDKVDIEISSPTGGVVTRLLAEEGQTVEVGQELFEIDTEGKLTEAKGEEKSEDTAPPAAPPKEKTPSEKTSPPPPQQPAEAPETRPPPPAKPKSPQVAPAAAAATGDANVFGENRVKMSRMRQRIAERLKEAQNTAAMLTTFNEVDMSNLIALRNRCKDDFLKKHNVKLGFMSLFLAAASSALKDQPVVNAVIDGQEIVYRDRIDISVAVSSPKGLVVPVIRGCNDFNLADFEKAIAALSAKARDGSIAIEDMTGGTFTISNGGVFGSLMGTPIINPPQSAILGMHSVQDRPVAVNGAVEIRPMMYIALTYDHRLIDGREAVLFLRHIKAMVEDPARLLLAL